MWCRDVNYIDIWICNEFGVGAIGLGCARSLDFFEEIRGTGGRGGRGSGRDDMLDIVNIAGRGVGEEISCECWTKSIEGSEVEEPSNLLLAIPPVARIPQRHWKGAFAAIAMEGGIQRVG